MLDQLSEVGSSAPVDGANPQLRLDASGTSWVSSQA